MLSLPPPAYYYLHLLYTTESTLIMEQPSSNLFEGYKSVGNVTGPLPFIVRHGKSPQDTRILTIVGKTIHTYTTNLSLVEVSIPHEHSISSIISDERYLFSAAGRAIFVWNRGSRNLICKLDNPNKSNIKLIVKFGSNRVISVDEDNVLVNWCIKEKKVLNSITFPEGTNDISTLCHPLNYKDKVLIGSKDGKLQLWNIVTEECIYKFSGWESCVTCLVQSPVQDVVGIGLEDGHVYVHNIKYDETVMKIYQEYGSVTSMSFRLDGQPYLVTASEVGHLMIWNLERRRLSSQIRNAHTSIVSKCQFIRNETLMVTTGTDNSLKVWTMDMSDGSGTLLSQRAGHSEPPSQIKFYGPKGFNLLSGGADSTLKMFHIYSERLNRNLGTARTNAKSKKKELSNKLPSIVCFAAEPAKEKQWDNIAACHAGSSLVSTWSYDKCRIGDKLIAQPSFSKHEVSATSICVTGCGNYVIIGFSNGLIFKYNIQSHIFRQCYECEELDEHRAHDGPVTGLTVDSLGIVLISSGSDGKMRIWNFKTGVLLIKNEFSSPIIKLELHRENNLIAIALENNHIEIMDLETRTMIRKFEGSSKIYDMTFSPDSRWLIVSYGDKSIRTWDLNLGKMIDSFSLATQCTSLSMSSTGEFLATAHENSLSINIWCNYTIYCPTALRPLDPQIAPPVLDMPYVRCDDNPAKEDEESEDQLLPVPDTQQDTEYVSPSQLHENLITMSGLPSSRWKNLLSLQEIREKQLVEEEERRAKPVKVPFFIPVKDGLRPQLDKEVVEKLNQEASNQSQLITSKIHELSLLSPLARCLISCGENNQYTPFLDQLKELGPSATDAEIRSLGPDTCGDNQAMLCFLDAIDEALKKNIDYELVSAWLALFLKSHSDIIQTDSETCKRCLELMDAVKSKWNRLSGEFERIFCVLNFIRSSIL